MEKITYKGVVIHISEHKHMRSNERGKDSHPESYITYKATTSYGDLHYDDFEEKDKEKTITRIKAAIDAIDMLVARTDEQLAEYLSMTVCEENALFEATLHPVLMKMVLGNARIPVKPNNTTHEPPDLANKPWWVRIKDWIENWNRKPQPNASR